MLISYACNPYTTKGRLLHENPTPYRNEFERDRDRIIHSNAFRRLQYKTQVFINPEGDHYRNRLTHSIEVSSIARSLAKALHLSDDLAESVAIAHDLGHAPFGHAGEEVLNKCLKNYGGFCHNAHALKIIAKLEKLYAAYDGLNLTWEVLEGIVKHNGPLTGKVPEFILNYNQACDLDLGHYCSAEGQLASLSDDITYICHDLKDSIRARIIDFKQLEEIEFIDQYIACIRSEYQNISFACLIYEVGRKITHHLIEDLLLQTNLNLKKQKIETSYDVRNLGYQLVDFSQSVKAKINIIKQFLFKNVYRHPSIVAVTSKCQRIIKDLFELYINNTDLLPFNFRELIDRQDSKSTALTVADYIAGMSDRFAIKEHQSFYNLNFNSI